jgi:hypothetical protein
MALTVEKTSQTDYKPTGDTQGIMIPQPVRFTRFRPSNITATEVSASVAVIPTPAQCIAGGGEDWNSGTNIFRVPRGGIYTVTVPAFSTANNITAITCQVIVNPASGSGIDTKSIIINTSVSQTNEWDARDVSVFVPEGGYIRIAFYIYQAPGTILFDRTATDGIFSIYLNEVAAPYIVANRGALVSSDTPGRVRIDGDGTMSISGELGTGTDGRRVSINRPDLWTTGLEYDFGGGLYGQRFTGTITETGGVPNETGIGAVTLSGIVSCGGYFYDGASICCFPFSHTNPVMASLYFNGNMKLFTVSNSQRTAAPYDVWVTYRK